MVDPESTINNLASQPKTKIIKEAEGETTIIEVQPGHTAVVFTPEGTLDLALIPSTARLQPIEGTDDYEVNGGMMCFMAIMMAACDPDVRALVQKKFDELNNDP